MSLPAAGLALHLLHLWVWALYAGGLTFIYVSLFPDIRRWLDSDERFEQFSLATADGLRWWILGSLIVAGLSGIGLAIARSPARSDALWWTLIAAKTALWAVTLILYVYVSYVMWPKRVFASAAERPGVQRRFARVALVLGALVTAQLVLGALLHAAP